MNEIKVGDEVETLMPTVVIGKSEIVEVSAHKLGRVVIIDRTFSLAKVELYGLGTAVLSLGKLVTTKKHPPQPAPADDLASLKAENAALKAALKPFAKAAEELIAADSKDYDFEHYTLIEVPVGKHFGVDPDAVTIGHFRKAREVYKS